MGRKSPLISPSHRKRALSTMPLSIVAPWSLLLLTLGSCSGPDDNTPANPNMPGQNGPIQCLGTQCTQPIKPLAANIQQNLLWDPCAGAPFSYVIDGYFEANKDTIQIGDSMFTGPLDKRMGHVARAPANIRLVTDATGVSPGLSSLVATCHPHPGSTPTGPGTPMGTHTSPGTNPGTGPGTNPGPTDLGVLSCSGLSCTTGGKPLRHLDLSSVLWNPCNGGAFFYSGKASLEDGQDFLFIDSRSFTGAQVALDGEASGPVTVRLQTNASQHSAGIHHLVAKCKDTGPKPEPVEYLRCPGLSCETPQPTLANDLDVRVSWNPCNGGAFRFRGRVDLELERDFLHIGTHRYTGVNDIAERIEGAVEVRIVTDAANPSRGITNLQATCEQDPGTGNTPGDSSTGDTPGDTSTGQPTPTATLSCRGAHCSSDPAPLPEGQNLVERNWDPCGGRAFTITGGTIALIGDNGPASRDHLQIGDWLFSGNRQVRGNFRGPVDLELVTIAGSTQSNGIVNQLQAQCGTPNNYGLVCEGLSCQNGGPDNDRHPLPGNFNETVTWNPCPDRPFTWSGRINLDAGDSVTVNGERHTGRTPINGSATGPIRVQVQTNRYGDSRGIESLQAVCGTNSEPSGLLATTMSNWSDAQADRFVAVLKGFLQTRARMFEVHQVWHHDNDEGEAMDELGNNGRSGTRGPGSGITFLGMHRAMVNALQNYARAPRDGGQAIELRPIDPYGEIHRRFPQALAILNELNERSSGEFNFITNQGGAQAHRERVSSTYGGANYFGVPRYFMLGQRGQSGGGTNWRGSLHQRVERSYTIRGAPIIRLDQFLTPEELGAAMGFSGYHSQGHATVGGNLATVYSPLDPVFWGWHKLLDDILQFWFERTANGRAWANANRGHPLLSTTNTDMTQWRDWEEVAGWSQNRFPRQLEPGTGASRDNGQE